MAGRPDNDACTGKEKSASAVSTSTNDQKRQNAADQECLLDQTVQRNWGNLVAHIRFTDFRCNSDLMQSMLHRKT
jgi:hypothetical protein